MTCKGYVVVLIEEKLFGSALKDHLNRENEGRRGVSGQTRYVNIRS